MSKNNITLAKFMIFFFLAFLFLAMKVASLMIPWDQYKTLSNETYTSRVLPPSEPLLNRENYAHFDDNPLKRASEHPISTFSIDVDSGSYSNVRRMLNYGQLPPHDAVRVEEMINYFSYDYPQPDHLDPPFKVTTEIAPTPWNQKTHLLHIGIKGYNIPKDKLPPTNLVFLVDVSGSMRSPNKLELLKSSLKLLTQQLTTKDKVSLVVYAGASGLVLEPTQGNRTGVEIPVRNVCLY